MRKLFLLVSVIMLVACSTEYEHPAEEVKSVSQNSFKVSEEEAIERLEKMLSTFDPATRGKTRTIKEVVAYRSRFRKTRAYAAEIPDTLFYYVNFDNNEGFAVLAADERLEPIIALIDNGNYTPSEDDLNSFELLCDSIPPLDDDELDDFWCDGINPHVNELNYVKFNDMEDLISQYGESTILNGDSYTKTFYTDYEVRYQVGPYLDTKWSQGDPYNRMCNKIGDDNFIYQTEDNRNAGCVAIAVSQVLNFHKYPSEANGRSFDWNKINTVKGFDPKRSPDSIWNMGTLYEVASLVRSANIACKTQYFFLSKKNGSSTANRAKKNFIK